MILKKESDHAMKAKPFLKWAGGKTQLLPQFDQFFLHGFRQHQCQTYVEPFVGSGAVFLAMMQTFPINTAYISDRNPDLMLTYQVIQQRVETLIDFLASYQHLYDTTPPEERKHLFLEIRRHFNAQRVEINYTTFAENWIARAAQLITLNKTCFNGLFRLNSKGEFNVPYGESHHPKILDSTNLHAVSKLLQQTEIRCGDYSRCLDMVDDRTFVYFDPPYRPLTPTASFTTYTGGVFDDDQQRRLADFFRKLDQETHAKLMLSNSDPQNEHPGDRFFEELYTGYYLYRVSATRMINSNGQKRGAVNELVITNYPNAPQTLAGNCCYLSS